MRMESKSRSEAGRRRGWGKRPWQRWAFVFIRVSAEPALLLFNVIENNLWLSETGARYIYIRCKTIKSF